MISVLLFRQSDALVRVGFDQDKAARCATVAAATFIQFNGVLIAHVEHDSRGSLILLPTHLDAIRLHRIYSYSSR